MNSPKQTKIIIPRDGISTGDNKPRAIYDPLSAKVMGALGTMQTIRASNVEPGSALSREALACLHMSPDRKVTNCIGSGGTDAITYMIKPEFATHWFADMTPTGRNVVLGPYPPDQREQALTDEVQWLKDNNVPVCEPCRDVVRPVFKPLESEMLLEVDSGPKLPGFEQYKPTGRTSSAEPNLSNSDMPRKPNFQPTNKPMFQGAIIQQVDYSKVEESVLDHHRDSVAEVAFTGLCEGRTVIDFNGWQHVGNQWSRVVFLAPQDELAETSERHVAEVIFTPGTIEVASKSLTHLPS